MSETQSLYSAVFPTYSTMASKIAGSFFDTLPMWTRSVRSCRSFHHGPKRMKGICISAMAEKSKL